MCILFHYLVNILGKILTKYVNAISLLKLLPFHSIVVKTEFLLKRTELKENDLAIKLDIPEGLFLCNLETKTSLKTTRN